MKKIYPAVLVFVFLLLLSGCGSDSSSPDATATVLLRGVVEDGPVGKATISLRDNTNTDLVVCGSQGKALCVTEADDAGAFSLVVKDGTDLADLSLVVIGVDFIGPELCSPLALFTGDLTALVITPLTTLVAKLQDEGLSLSAAQDRVRDWLLLLHNTNLAVRPSLSPVVKNNDLFLNKIALEINAKSPEAQPFLLIAAQISSSNLPLFAEDATTLNPSVMEFFGLDAESQVRIEALAERRLLYLAASPLLEQQLPGNDNQKRVAYFYESDLSPHYQAEQLTWRIYDDAINDAVLLKIVEGKANAGLIAETRAIIATEIVQSEPKAHADRALANTLIKFNRPQEALESLDLARDLYRQVISAKGVASASSTDVENLMATIASYRKAGDLDKAQSLFNDVNVIAQALSSNAGSYARLITGIKQVADVYIDAGELEAAAPLIDEMYKFSLQTPALAGTYKLRIYNWSECAKRYADLGDREKVVTVFSDVEALRKVDVATATATWVYLPDLVESLYRVGEKTKALCLADTIPEDSSSLGKAFKFVATYEALQGNMAQAFSIVDNSNYLPKDEDKIELLTYFNDSRPYIAQALIDAGRISDARLALEKAEVLLDSMTQSNNLIRISNGYVKVAELYALMGDNPKAAALLNRAQKMIVGDVYQITAMADIALGYYNLNQTEVALNHLDTAKNLADVDPTRFRANTTLNLGEEEYSTQLYEKLIKSYQQVGEKDSVRTVTFSFQSCAQEIHSAGTVNDSLAGKESDYLLRAALYLDGAGYHAEALNTLDAARQNAAEITVAATRLKIYLSVIETYAAVHEYKTALVLALSLEFTAERNQAIQGLCNAYIDRNDFPESAVASIDSDGDGKPDFFHPLATEAEIAASGLILDDDSDGDGIVDTRDFRPLFAD